MTNDPLWPPLATVFHQKVETYGPLQKTHRFPDVAASNFQKKVKQMFVDRNNFILSTVQRKGGLK